MISLAYNHFTSHHVKSGILKAKDIGEKMNWIRYRFKTRAVDDYRPLIFNPKYPWWCSGETDKYAVIIAYLPKEESLLKYWDDAFDVDSEEKESIEFTDRFPKPDYFVE